MRHPVPQSLIPLTFAIPRVKTCLKRFSQHFALSLCVMMLGAPGSRAEWTRDANQNTPVCRAKEEQHFPDLAPDGSGGVIVAWRDARNENRDVFAQRVGARGEMLWGHDGVPICDLPSAQSWPIVLTDGNNGAIIVFGDFRKGARGIYAQRIDTDGKLLWGKEGLPICIEPSLQIDADVKAMPDDKGGAIIVWEDWRNGNQDIYAQRIDSSGKPLWELNGVAVYRGDGDQYDPFLATDGENGAIVVWWDISTPDWDIFAQRLDTAGKPVWGAEGVAVSTATGNQGGPFIVADGAGGAFVVWSDYRNDPNIYTSADLYAQRISAEGKTLWAKDGVGICKHPANQQQPTGISDGMGGLIAVWWDDRDVFSDIYAQRIGPDGGVMWEVNGTAVCVAEGEQRLPQLVSDGSHGAVIYWMDYREDYGEVTADAIYAQRIDANGKSIWAFNGIPVCTADGNQVMPSAIPNGVGGAFIAWSDERGEHPDIYIHQIP